MFTIVTETAIITELRKEKVMQNYVLDCANAKFLGAYRTREEAEVHLDRDQCIVAIHRQEDIVCFLKPRYLNGDKIVKLYNQITGKDINRMSDNKTGVARLWDAMQSIQPEEKEVKTVSGVKPKEEANIPKKETRGRKSKFSDHTVLTTTLTENPRRKGSNGYNSMQIIIEAKDKKITYAQYINLGGRRQDLVWDLDKGNVVIVS